ncbi:hypothetical protein [Devosia sp. CN2-171]|jgi:hypothetical protein|uniref:hypothetical protein n=1 Tax=Devosia sp. CN2-171 TaxID=3400909 RepID=UPI003BF77768
MMITASTVARLIGTGAITLALSACSMGNMFAPAAAGPSPMATANPTAAELQTGTNNALPAIATECPPIKVKPGSEALFYYGKGKVGNARDLNYQAIIDKQSRNCVVSNGLITVKMGMVGRLLLGPAGNQTNVNVPVRFTVERDGVALFSEKYEIPVTITPPNQSEEFVKVVENVAVPYTGGEQIVFYVGFDS